jgi:hypothetical protein
MIDSSVKKTGSISRSNGMSSLPKSFIIVLPTLNPDFQGKDFLCAHAEEVDLA